MINTIDSYHFIQITIFISPSCNWTYITTTTTTTTATTTTTTSTIVVAGIHHIVVAISVTNSGMNHQINTEKKKDGDGECICE